MSSSVIAFIRAEVPTLYQHALGRAAAAAEEAEPHWEGRLVQMQEAEGSAHVIIEGEGDLWISVRRGDLQCSDVAPTDVPCRVALRAGKQAAAIAIEDPQTRAGLDDPLTHLGVAFLTSADVMKTAARFPMHGELRVEGVPELGDVSVAIGLPGPDAPTDYGFSVTTQYDDLEDVRLGELAPRRLLMGGKLRFQGAYTPFLQLGMALLQHLKL